MWERSAARLAEEQHGLVARRQLRASGAPFVAIRALASSPHWRQLSDEVFARVGASETREQRTLAAVLDAGPGATLSHLSAAAWWGVQGCSLEPLHVVRCGASSRRRTELATVHRVRALPVRWTTQLRRIPVVRPELLALHLYAVCAEGRAERLVKRIWSMRLLSGTSLAVFLDELGARGRDGTRGLRAYVELRGRDYTPPASGLEARAMQLFREAGVDMRRQVDSGGDLWVGRVDFRHAELPLVVEIQSEAYHSALLERRSDAARVAALAAAGFAVIELTDEQVWSRPWEVGPAVLAEVARLEARHRRPAT